MTILDKIAENAEKYPDRLMYCTENMENMIGGGRAEQLMLERIRELFQPSGSIS